MTFIALFGLWLTHSFGRAIVDSILVGASVDCALIVFLGDSSSRQFRCCFDCYPASIH